MILSFTKKKPAEIKQNVYELYKDASELPLYRWIKLAVTGDYKWLIKSGNTNDDLSEAYQSIFTEYTALVKDVRSAQELKLKISITTLANRIDHITLCINQLKISPDERLVDILKNDLGFFKIDYSELSKALVLIENLMRSDIIKLEQKKQQYEKLIGNTDAASGNEEANFYEQISLIEKWKGYAINPHTTSLLQYIVYLNQLKLEIKNNQAENQRRY